MKEKLYVDKLFENYEDTPEMADFKEEITVNLKERVKEFISKGLDEDRAFEAAVAELGDITAIADEVGRKKRSETIGQMYINARAPISKKSAAGYALAAGLLLFGCIVSAMAYSATKDLSHLFASACAFIPVSCALFTLTGLTQETASLYPMKIKRAIFYALACGFGVFGLCTAAMLFITETDNPSAALGTLMAFMLPAICVLIFLAATETRREKPWLKAIIDKENEKAFTGHYAGVDQVKAAKFGVMSVGLWILSGALFLTLGFIIGWKFSWLVFPFALAVQFFMTTMIFEK